MVQFNFAIKQNHKNKLISVFTKMNYNQHFWLLLVAGAPVHSNSTFRLTFFSLLNLNLHKITVTKWKYATDLYSTMHINSIIIHYVYDLSFDWLAIYR